MLKKLIRAKGIKISRNFSSSGKKTLTSSYPVSYFNHRWQPVFLSLTDSMTNSF